TGQFGLVRHRVRQPRLVHLLECGQRLEWRLVSVAWPGRVRPGQTAVSGPLTRAWQPGPIRHWARQPGLVYLLECGQRLEWRLVPVTWPGRVRPR
ncbi:MAG TPA: hypothetical protein PKK23_05770, partial [Nitrospirales bacterium]|nr:hypothetical protein [Nitrospirales bacterium]